MVFFITLVCAVITAAQEKKKAPRPSRPGHAERAVTTIAQGKAVKESVRVPEPKVLRGAKSGIEQGKDANEKPVIVKQPKKTQRETASEIDVKDLAKAAKKVGGAWQDVEEVKEIIDEAVGGDYQPICGGCLGDLDIQCSDILGMCEAFAEGTGDCVRNVCQGTGVCVGEVCQGMCEECGQAF